MQIVNVSNWTFSINIWRHTYLIPPPERVSGNVDNWAEAGQAVHGLVDSLHTVHIPVSTDLVWHRLRHVVHQFRAKQNKGVGLLVHAQHSQEHIMFN